MESSRFWEIIALSRQPDGDQDKQLQALRQQLDALSPEEIVSFQTHFYACQRAAYRWDLWGAGYILNGGCSDDSFMDFRSWLISQGQERYEAALRDPETLAEFFDPENDCCVFEVFAYVGSKAYKAKTGHDELPITLSPHPDPAGERWEEDDLPQRFPKLWAIAEEE